MPTARHSPEERRTLVSMWRASGQSQSRFAVVHGVAQSSFSKWVARYTPACNRARPSRSQHAGFSRLAQGHP